jgi:hypothetical protein
MPKKRRELTGMAAFSDSLYCQQVKKLMLKTDGTLPR